MSINKKDGEIEFLRPFIRFFQYVTKSQKSAQNFFKM